MSEDNIDYPQEIVAKVTSVSLVRAAMEGLPPGVEPSLNIQALLKDEWPGHLSSIERIRAALLELDELGRHHRARGTFWKVLMLAAENVGMEDLRALFRTRFRDARLRSQ